MPSPPLTPLAAAVLHVDRAPERVLEIGCGAGEGTLFLAREFPRARVRGVDRSEEVHKAVARVGLDPEGRIAFKAGRPKALPFPDDFFDLVAQIDSRPATAEIVRVLRPGGHLIVAVERRPGWPFGLDPQRLGRKLARHGIEPVEIGEAGNGAFYVGRLRGGD